LHVLYININKICLCSLIKEKIERFKEKAASSESFVYSFISDHNNEFIRSSFLYLLELLHIISVVHLFRIHYMVNIIIYNIRWIQRNERMDPLLQSYINIKAKDSNDAVFSLLMPIFCVIYNALQILTLQRYYK